MSADFRHNNPDPERKSNLFPGGALYEKAVELISRLDYDFSLAQKDKAMSSGVIARTLELDRDIAALKSTEALRAADRNPCSWNIEFYLTVQ